MEETYEEYVERKWQEYISQPVNFGADDVKTRLAEEDAFKAGAKAIFDQFVPF